MIKRNIIISGALGQDGKILTNLLNKKKYNIIGIVKKLPKIINKKLICVKINLSNYKKVNKFVNETNPLAFIHFGSANPSFKQTENNNFYYKNLLITKNLINCFTKLKKNKLILVGSSQMYSSKIKKINLNSKFKYKNSYAKFRIDSYNYMKKIKSKFNSNIVMAILFNHDSVHRNKKFLIPRMIKMIKNKKFEDLEKIYKENISSDFSHAEDICSGLNKLIFLKKNPDKLIFSSNKRTHVNDIIKFLLKENKIIYKFNSFKTKMILPIGDNSLTRSLLNWKLRKNIFVAAKNMNSISYKKN